MKYLVGQGDAFVNGKNYKLRILPLFEEDLNEIIDYIAYHLKNPVAAENFLNAVEAAIYKRLPNAESFEPYHSIRERKYPYYRIIVKNFIIFYVVIDNVMEERRIVYSRSNCKEQI